ncbi:hypothetical protein B0H11DRAFT_2423567 [Mycena galericulata]|nr:hypothetical protein B0H11DRAFT_2423567 [Mycena galericulata]
MLSLVVVSAFLTLCWCGNLTSPTWRKPNITTSLANRVSIAGAALDMAISMLGSDAQFDSDGASWGNAGSLYSQMADYDIATNQNKYEASLKNYFLQASQLQNNFSGLYTVSLNDGLFAFLSPLGPGPAYQNGPCRAYGHAAARAYEAYKDPVFLDYAVQSWWFGRSYTLSSQEVSSGSSGVKSFPIEGICGGTPMTGGTFWVTLTDQPTLNGLGTGNFLTVSALLAEATSDPMYLQAATEAIDFIHNHLLNTLNEVEDNISARANDSCSGNTSLMEPYNSGLMIEGLSILYSITGNATVQELLNLVLAAAISNKAWQGSNGVIDNGGEGDLNLMQGVTAVYTRNATTPDNHADLEQYIAVQFNAVLDLATVNGSNVYGSAWVGPPSSVFSGGNQTTALSALIGALNIPGNASETTVSGTTPSASVTQIPPSPPAQNKSSRNDVQVAVIAGVLGGVAFVAIAGGVWAVRRRRLRSRGVSVLPTSSNPSSGALVEPFTDGNRSFLPLHVSFFPRRPSHKYSRPPAQVIPAVSSKRTIHTNAGVVSRPPSATLEGQNSPAQRPSSLQTDMLVRMLNERLQGREWDDGEAPPEYPE